MGFVFSHPGDRKTWVGWAPVFLIAKFVLSHVSEARPFGLAQGRLWGTPSTWSVI